jgi:hypothetical protein
MIGLAEYPVGREAGAKNTDCKQQHSYHTPSGGPTGDPLVPGLFFTFGT